MKRSAWPSAAAIVDLAFQTGDRKTFRPALMHLLMRTAGADLALLTELDQSPELESVVHLPLAMVEGARQEFIRSPADLLPVREALQRKPVVRDLGFGSRRQWESTEMFQRFHRPLGVTFQIGALLPGTPPRHLSLIRAGRT